MKKIILSLLVSAGLLSGCATVMGKNAPYPVSITSTPDEAQFTVSNRAGLTVAHGVTPQTILLKAYAGPYRGETYTITFNKTGYKSHTIQLDSTPNGWYVGGNLIFGGLLGWLVVDPLTGAMFSLPSSAFAQLTADDVAQNGGLNIISLAQLTEEQKKELQPIHTH